MPLGGAAPDAVSASGRQAGEDAFRQEKIAWYREVLALEPGSKVFLPFARLLAEMGRGEEAVAVLQAGLERHPEYIEARLFFIDLLHRAGRRTQCGAEVARLAGLFREYPGFWEAWGALEQADGRPDFSVSLRVLGAMFRDSGVTFTDVLAAGLQALRHDGRNTAPSLTEERPAEREEQPSAGADDPAAARADESPAAMTEEPLAVAEPEERVEDAPEASGPGESLVCERPAGEADVAPVGEEKPASGGKCSLRTRSMAEVLAEQGDVTGAIDIYEELLSSCKPVDRQAVQDRLDDLRARQGNMASVELPAPSGAMGPVGGGMPSASAPVRKMAAPRSGVVELLEKLAVRLEKKARA